MFVPAPYRKTVGTTAASVTILLRDRATTYGSKDEAKALLFDFNKSNGSMSSLTRRLIMGSGRMPDRTFVPTAYQSNYRSVRSSGWAHQVLRKKTGGFMSQSHPMGLTGSFNAVGGDPSGLIDYYSSSIDPIAIYNRAVIGSNRNRCLVEAKNKLVQQKMDLAESLVDIVPTVLMVAERTLQVLSAVNHLRNRNWKAAARSLGISKSAAHYTTPAKAWLEYQYGWKPLVNDIFSGIEQCNQKMKESGAIVYATRRTSEPLFYSGHQPNLVWPEISSTAEAKTFCEVKFRGRINDATMAYLSGLQALNPLYAVWVATPFSFVADWFIPVGDWLSSMSSTMGLTFVSGYRSTKTWGWVRTSAPRKPFDSIQYEMVEEFGTPTLELGALWIDREKFISWPMSQLYFRFPFKSPERIASAVSLATTTSGHFRR